MAHKTTADSNPRVSVALWKQYFVGVFLAVSIFLLLWVFLQQYPVYPAGWDAPYYISYTKSFLEAGETSSRAGMVAIIGAFHSMTGVSLVNIYRGLTVVSMVFLATGTALLAASAYQKKLTTFLLTFFFGLWYQYSFMLSLSTFDNALGVILVVFACFFLGKNSEKNGNVLAFFSLALLMAVTHIESFAFLLLVVGVVITFRVFTLRSIVKTIREKAKFLIALVIAAIVALFQWSNLIRSIVQTYTNTADVGGNASIPYASNQNLSEFFYYARTGIVEYVFFISFLFGVALLIFFAKKSFRTHERVVTLSYVAAAYCILLFSVFRASIPINRSILLLPVPLVVGLGLSWFFSLLQRRRGVGIAGVSIVLLLFAILPTTKYREYAQRVPPSIQPSVYAGMIDLARHQQEHVTGSYAVLGNTQKEVQAASAYYLLWYHWMTALLPTSDTVKGYCVYFGSPENFLTRTPTPRPGNQEYVDTNTESLSCLDSLPSKENVRLFSVRGLYPGEFPPMKEGFKTVTITENLAELTFTNK